jgi:predicted Zn-dependent peptidase
MTRTRTFSTALLAGVMLAFVPAAAQGPPGQAPSTVGMTRKNKAPVSNEVLKVSLPKPQEAHLANGLHLMVLEDRRLPRISFQIVIPGAGGYFDPPDKIGLASYTAQMMREGTKARTSVQMSQDIETMAASLAVTAGTGTPNASVSGSALTENFDKLLDMAADVLLNPTFPAEEWDRLKPRAKAALLQQRTQPGFLAAEMANKVMYADHPAGRLSATAQSLDAITRDAMIEWHKTRYVPDHALIAFAGDISLAEARKKVEARLAGWAKSGTPKPKVAEPSSPGPAKVSFIARPNSVQTTLLVAAPSMDRLHADYEELTVANRVLGGTMGRLFRHLREEKGYTYGVGSGFSATNHRGDWTASTNVRTEVTEAALGDLMKDIAEMRDKPVPADELRDHQRAVVASFALSLESPQQVLGYYTQAWLYGLPADYWQTYPARISAVTPEQAQAAAKKYWDPAKMHIIAVGDAKVVEALKKHGTVETYDTEGKPIK